MHNSAKLFLEKTNNINPDIAVILGSGLTNFFEDKNIISSISYEDLPDFPKPTVKGHAGKHECSTCSKNVKAYYTGKEPSPKGLGYCARCTPLNIIMKGKDGNLWENKKYSKGKRWVRV